MRLFIYLIVAIFICPLSFPLSVVTEITPDNLERFEYDIVINDKNDLLTFDVTCPPLWRRESHSVAVLIINKEEITISKSNLEQRYKNGKASFHFEVSKDYLEHSKFEYTMFLQKHPALDRQWFNLKKMYDGLKAIEEEKN